jgi:hypothetical protein
LFNHGVFVGLRLCLPAGRREVTRNVPERVIAVQHVACLAKLPEMELKEVILHVGLPKTGTTTLQREFFIGYSRYAGKRGLRDFDSEKLPVENYRFFRSYQQLREIYLRFSGDSTPTEKGWRAELSGWADELCSSDSERFIVSEEMLSLWWRGLEQRWPVEYKRLSISQEQPHPLIRFLQELRSLLPAEVALRTILTLRNQHDFLASHAAELGNQKYFDSADFDFLVTHGDAFLDYHRLVRDLEGISGAQNHLTVFFEDGLSTWISEIVDFIGPPDLVRDHLTSRGIPIHNPRKSAPHSWTINTEQLGFRKKLRSASRFFRQSKLWPAFQTVFRLCGPLFSVIEKLSKKPHDISVSDDDRSRVRDSCRFSNDLLSAHVGRDLSVLGY